MHVFLNFKIKPGENNSWLIFLIISTVISFSCTEKVNFIETNKAEIYVLNSLFSPNSEIQLFLNRTSNILDDSTYYLNASNIQLYENSSPINIPIEKLEDRYIIHYFPKSNKKYTIEVSIPFYNKLLVAEDILPSMVQIANATYKYPVYTDKYDTRFGNLEISFTDENHESNYYEIILLSNNRLIHTLKVNHPVITVDSENDPIVYPTLIFTDEKFKNSELTLDIFVDSYYSPVVILRNMSYNYYMYKKYLYMHLDNQNIDRENVYEVFKGDPIDLYSNVMDGLGIFASFSENIKQSSLIQ